ASGFDVVVTTEKVLRTLIRRIIRGSKLMLGAVRHLENHFPPLILIEQVSLPVRQTAVFVIIEPLEIFIAVANINLIGAADPPSCQVAQLRRVNYVRLPIDRVVVMLTSGNIPKLTVVFGFDHPR